jgi:hypothetical protein
VCNPVRVGGALWDQIPAARTRNLSRNTIAVFVGAQAGTGWRDAGIFEPLFDAYARC